MKHYLISLNVFCLLIASNPMKGQVENVPSAPAIIGDSLQTILDNAVQQHNITGGIMAVYSPGKWVWYGTTGSASRDSLIPITPKFNFRIASISKSFVAISLLQLQQNGVLNLNDTLGTWIRQTLVDSIPNGHSMTIRQLLNHSSGLGSNTGNVNCLPQTTNDLLMPITFKEALNCGLQLGPEFFPGTSFSYTNTNYTLAAEIVEIASGLDFTTYIQQNIIIPAGLTSTFVPTSNQLSGDYMRCYWNTYPYFSDWSIVHPSVYKGYAGLVSNAEDLFKYYEAINGLELFNQSTWDEMFTTMIPTGFNGYEYGLGIDNEDYGKFEVLGHHGEVGNSNYWYYYPELDAYLIYNMTNQGFFPMSLGLIENPVYNLLYATQDVTLLEVDINARVDEMVLFPNPATDYFSIKLNEDINSAVSLQILDISGRKISGFDLRISSGMLEVTGLDFEPGIYQVICGLRETTYAVRLLIK